MFGMSSFDIVVTLIITVVAYMGFPFYKFCLSKENYDLNFRKKIIFWNSVIAAILFTLIRIIANGTDGDIVNFAPAFTYYCINSLLYARKKSNQKKEVTIDKSNLEKLDNSNFNDNDEEELSTEQIEIEERNINLDRNNNIENKDKKKTNVNPKNYTLLYLIIICITVITSVGIFSYSNYQKEQLKQKQENERLEAEQNAAQLRQTQLNNCITQAKSNRTNLWNQNCTKQANGSCTIKSNSGVSEWIEQRYQQDLDNCYQLYSN